MPYGLESLIPKKQSKTGVRKNESVFWIETKKIKPNPLQPRKKFNSKNLKELASSIEKYGILQPLIVKKTEKYYRSSSRSKGMKVEYQIIAGERRFRAAKLLGMKEVPVIVDKIKKEDELPISLVENLQREDLNPIERAKAFKKLAENFRLTQAEIGKIVGKSKVAITNTLRILNLPAKIKKSISNGEISEGHARALLTIKEEDRMKVFKDIIEKKISTRVVEQKSATRIKIMKEEKLLQSQDKLSKILKVEKLKLRKLKNKIEVTLLFKSKKEFNDFMKKIQKTVPKA